MADSMQNPLEAARLAMSAATRAMDREHWQTACEQLNSASRALQAAPDGPEKARAEQELTSLWRDVAR